MNLNTYVYVVYVYIYDEFSMTMYADNIMINPTICDYLIAL